MKRPIRTVHSWNVFVEGDDEHMTVEYRLRWMPSIGGRIRVSNGVARDWRQMSLESFSRKYFKLRNAEWRKAQQLHRPSRDESDNIYDDVH